MFQINVKDAKIKLEDLIQAAKNGEDILLVTEDQVKFIIEIADKPLQVRPIYGSAEGLFEMADDFDAPLEAFQDYMP